MGADSGCSQKVERTAVCMSEWEEREYFVSLFKKFGADTESDISCQIVPCQHHSFTETGGSGSIV